MDLIITVGAGIDRQRLVLEAIIEKVTVAPTTGHGNRFNPDRAR